MEAIRTMTAAELTSATRGQRRPRIQMMDVLAALALGEWATAERLWNASTSASHQGPSAGVLHLMSKRGDVRAIEWLLDHAADHNARWSHWDADVTPLHLAVLGNHADAARLLLAKGADPTIRDSLHDSDAIGWAEFFGRAELAGVLRASTSR
jgi:hypothetical protein